MSMQTIYEAAIQRARRAGTPPLIGGTLRAELEGRVTGAGWLIVEGVPVKAGSRPLGRRETEAFALVAEGFDGKEIAILMGTSAATVRHQLEQVMRKLGARNRAHAVAIAALCGKGSIAARTLASYR
jgi:DNA-binding CsgD family transcriptional regulator